MEGAKCAICWTLSRTVSKSASFDYIPVYAVGTLAGVHILSYPKGHTQEIKHVGSPFPGEVGSSSIEPSLVCLAVFYISCLTLDLDVPGLRKVCGPTAAYFAYAPMHMLASLSIADEALSALVYCGYCALFIATKARVHEHIRLRTLHGGLPHPASGRHVRRSEQRPVSTAPCFISLA